MRISDWSSDVCSSDLTDVGADIDAASERVDRAREVGDLEIGVEAAADFAVAAIRDHAAFDGAGRAPSRGRSRSGRRSRRGSGRGGRGRNYDEAVAGWSHIIGAAGGQEKRSEAQTSELPS